MLAPIALAAVQPSIADIRSSLIGRWTGSLEYRDYQSDRWFGLPVKIEIVDGGDGVTLIRRADYDDGPKAGTVRITTVAMLSADGSRETSATFRKGHDVELETALLTTAGVRDREHWTLVETIIGKDDDRPATIRQTTTRNGSSLVTLKEVDFRDDAKVEWLTRNRITLSRSK